MLKDNLDIRFKKFKDSVINNKYKILEQKGISFHYLSASPWQLYPILNQAMEDAGFPQGSIDLKYFRWKDETFMNFLASPVKYKTERIESFLTKYPKRTVILIGDSGELDPEIYGHIARKHPTQIT